MNVYKTKSFSEAVKGNSYVGRGIIVGMTSDHKYAATAYFIMGRSANSRNRVFKKEGSDLTIYPFDEKTAGDPSLIIYSPVRVLPPYLIITNGNQTDTVYDFLKSGETFENALRTRQFEPDSPNWTPRISAILTFQGGGFSYQQNILKSANAEGTACSRYTFSYPSLAGVGHFIHTYEEDGNPIPTFLGEPERISIPDDMDEFTSEIWNSLDENNKISLYVRYVNLSNLSYEDRLINKNK